MLNELVIDLEQGTIDSPLHPDQVKIVPNAPEALAALTAAGFELAIVSNQPASAKGKTTRANLEKVHERVLSGVQAAGGRIASSHLCFHRREDRCSCRKPGTALLEQALAQSKRFSTFSSWMIGDGVTDLQAGQALGIRTAFIAEPKADVMRVLHQNGVEPTIWVDDVSHFAQILLKQSTQTFK